MGNLKETKSLTTLLAVDFRLEAVDKERLTGKAKEVSNLIQ